jgi:hypothetical protein
MTNELATQKKKRTTNVSVDLLDLHEPWLMWCKANGVSSSDGFRLIVKKLTANTQSNKTNYSTNEGVKEKPTIKRKLSLTESEFKAIEEQAKAEGFSVAKWLISLIRARLTKQAQLGQVELELLARSNMQLLAIGRNLNQLAKALNRIPVDPSQYRLDLIELLEEKIQSHTKIVSGIVSSNVNRWSIDK